MAAARRLALLLIAALPLVAQAQAPSRGGDPLQSPACLAARQALDAAMAQERPAPQRLQGLRQRVAADCLQAAADPPRPARLARPPEAVAPVTPVTPVMPVMPVTPVIPAPPAAAGVPRAPAAPMPPAVPQPAQVGRCDAGGCWDNSGQRLNRSGAYLVDPQGRLCTQQGTVLSCP